MGQGETDPSAQSSKLYVLRWCLHAAIWYAVATCLDVAMDDAEVVQVGDRGHHLAARREGSSNRKRGPHRGQRVSDYAAAPNPNASSCIVDTSLRPI